MNALISPASDPTVLFPLPSLSLHQAYPPPFFFSAQHSFSFPSSKRTMASVSNELKTTILAMAKKYKWHTLGEIITNKGAMETTTARKTTKSYRKYDSDDDILDLTQSFGDVLTVADDDSDDDLFYRTKTPTKTIAKKQPHNNKTSSKGFHTSATSSSSASSFSSPDNNIAFKPNTKSKKLLDQRNDITAQLYLQYNQMAFGGLLPVDLSIVWSKRLTSTAGLTKMSVQTSTGTKQGEIILSEKVVDNVFRLKTTLLHEMCHAAAWFIDSTRKPPHGPSFWKWAAICSANIPGIVVTTCHNYQIHKPFQFKCMECKAAYGRHSKSIDINKHCCGVCKGRLEFVGTFHADGTPKRSR